MDGVTILNEGYNPVFTTMSIIIIPLAIISFICAVKVYVNMYKDVSENSRIGVLCAGIAACMLIVVGTISIVTKGLHTPQNKEYTVALSEDASYLEFTKNYKIIKENPDGTYVVNKIIDSDKNKF